MHVHEPNVPVVSWFAVEASPVPTVGTFHTYSTSRLVNGIAANVVGARRLYGKLSARIAVSEAAAWTARRFYGGRYRIVPNGVDLAAARPEPLARATTSRSSSSAAPRAARACRSCCAPSRRCAAPASAPGSRSPACPAEEVEPLLLDPEGVRMVGRVTEEEKWRLLGSVDLLCAPSLGGESFGMVLTEAFASGTPVVASDIAGYRDVVRDGVDGLLVPAGDPVELGEALRALALDPARRERMAAAARERAERFAWPRVAAEVTEVYEQALAAAAPRDRHGARGAARRAHARRARTARAAGAAARRSSPRTRRAAAARRSRLARRAVIGAGAAAGAGLTVLALERLGIESIGRALLAATPVWVLVGFMLMCLSMLVRAEAWHAILRAALPGMRVRRRDTARATMIGVLMSATLPARLGEPSRALIVARRLGPDARPLPGRARHARLADAAQHPRAVRARLRHVRDGRACSAAARTRS